MAGAGTISKHISPATCKQEMFLVLSQSVCESGSVTLFLVCRHHVDLSYASVLILQANYN